MSNDAQPRWQTSQPRWRCTHAALACALVISAASCGDNQPGPACLTGDRWAVAPPVRGGAIQETAVVSLDAKVYVLGGFDASIGVVPSVRIYDTASCTWSDGPPLPRAAHHVNAVVAGGTIYVVGALEGGSFTAIGEVWAWRPGTDAGWSPRARMPLGSERGSAVLGVIDGRIYVAGGLRTTSVTSLSSYSIADDRWDTALPPLPQARDHGCGGVFDGQLYVVGGRDNGAISGSVFVYSPGAGWSQRADLPTPRGGHACGVSGGRLVAAGGEGNAALPSGVFPQVEAYTVALDRWTTLDAMPTPRHGLGGAIVDDVLYLPGGAARANFGAVDTHEALRL